MKILVTGGSGTVGQHVLDQLSKNPALDIVAFDVDNLHTRKFYRRYGSSVKVHYGDLSNPKDIGPLCEGVAFVIHLAAIIPPVADERPELAHKVNVVGTRNLIEALEVHAKNAFFLYASSVSVYGDRLTDPWIRVGDPLQPSEGDEYARTKIQAEALVQASKLDWSIFRLSAIMGAGNHKISGLMFHMPLATQMEITTPEDTGRAFAHAIGKQEQLTKRIFNLGGGEACRISYKEFLTRSFSIFGLGALDFPEHAFAAKNFHCGYYADGDELEDMLGFRKDTMDSYFKSVEASVPPLQRFAASLFRKLVKWQILKKSDPLNAFKQKDKAMLGRYFN